MRTDDVKRHIYHTKKPVRAEDVRKIIAAIKKVGRITKDRTGEGYFSNCWEGHPPLPVLPEKLKLTFLGPDFYHTVTVTPAAFKEDPTLELFSRIIEDSSLVANACFGFSFGKLQKFQQISSLGLFLYPRENPVKMVMRIQDNSVTTATKQAVLSGLVAAGSWPVALVEASEGLTPLSTAGGAVEWNPENNELTFTWPGVSIRQSVAALAKTVRGMGIKGDFTCQITVHDDAKRSWKSLNRYLRTLEKMANPSLSFILSCIEWRLNGFEAFDSLAEMHAVFDYDEQIMTGMFEFKFAGQLGLMELAHEKKGYRAWFSFDDEKPFKELQMAIGYPLMEMQ